MEAGLSEPGLGWWQGSPELSPGSSSRSSPTCHHRIYDLITPPSVLALAVNTAAREVSSVLSAAVSPSSFCFLFSNCSRSMRIPFSANTAMDRLQKTTREIAGQEDTWWGYAPGYGHASSCGNLSACPWDDATCCCRMWANEGALALSGSHLSQISPARRAELGKPRDKPSVPNNVSSRPRPAGWWPRALSFPRASCW